MINKCTHILVFIFLLARYSAQEPQFTQFYANPMFLNPAFTGLTYEHRFGLNYRNQWPGINTGFTTSMASYDYNMSQAHSGIGLMAMQDQAGTSNLTTTQFGGNFAYSFKLNKFMEVRTGALVSYVQKKVDNSKLIFNDQLITGSPVSQAAINIQQANYADIGLGALLNATNFWLGAAVKHVNQPNTSFSGSVTPLPMYYNIHGGYRFNLQAQKVGRTNLEQYISASFNIRNELNYAQMDIGANYFKSVVNVGLWYRGLPFKAYKPGYPTRESIAILVGFDLKKQNLRVGYSYDITVSRLGINNTQGAHEIVMVYQPAQKRKKTRRVLVSCPKF